MTNKFRISRERIIVISDTGTHHPLAGEVLSDYTKEDTGCYDRLTECGSLITVKKGALVEIQNGEIVSTSPDGVMYDVSVIRKLHSGGKIKRVDVFKLEDAGE